MGAVYAGEHRFLGDRVAIKLLHGRHEPDDGAAQRFFLEARAARDIDHPAIIKILDFGQSDAGELYLVMELLEGRSLGRAIAEGRFGDGGAARVGALAADGLAAAHARGVIHRDLKPDNLFLVATGGVKILDFGIAKFLSSPTRMTDTGAVLGTPYYLAPEVLGGDGEDERSDLWSLGVTLYELATGERPFTGADYQTLFGAIRKGRPTRVRALVPAVPRRLAKAIERCLERRPDDRWETAALLAQELKTITRHLLGEVRPEKRLLGLLEERTKAPPTGGTIQLGTDDMVPVTTPAAGAEPSAAGAEPPAAGAEAHDPWRVPLLLALALATAAAVAWVRWGR
jgi:serine/threonine protein kinase